ncbi:MAG: GC-type dockerin domain-anchored protein [Phycisphaerales bacterium JB059]
MNTSTRFAAASVLVCGVVASTSADFTSASLRAASFSAADGSYRGGPLSESQRSLVEQAIQKLDDVDDATTQACVDCLRKMLANNRICVESGTSGSAATTLPDRKPGCNPRTEGIHLGAWTFRQTIEVIACVLAHEWFHTNQTEADYTGGAYELPAYQHEKACLEALGQTGTPRHMFICDQIAALMRPVQSGPTDPARTADGGKMLTTDDGWSYSFHSDFPGFYIGWDDNSSFWGHLHDVPNPYDASVYDYGGARLVSILGYDPDNNEGRISTWEVTGGGSGFFFRHALTMFSSEPFSHTGSLDGTRRYVLDTRNDRIVRFDMDAEGVFSDQWGDYARIENFPELAGALSIRCNLMDGRRGTNGDSVIIEYRDTRADTAVNTAMTRAVLFDDDNDGVADRVETLDPEGGPIGVQDFIAVVPGFVDEPVSGRSAVALFAGAGAAVEIQAVDGGGGVLEVLASGSMPPDANEAFFTLSRPLTPCELIRAVDTDNVTAVPPNTVEVRNAADLSEPLGVLDFDDVLAFLVAFGAMDPAADLAPASGVFDFDDILAFLTAFGAGCP